MKNVLLETALEYAARNFSVIPIIPGNKKPMIKWEPHQKERASKEQIVSWWTKTPKANIGIVTGEISDLFVVDIDSEEGQKNLLDYGFESIITPTVNTPRGGQHLYFRYPKGTNITIGAGKIPGTDFRGNGGYVLAPPSVNGNGKPYSWLIDLSTALSGGIPSIYIKKISTLYGCDNDGQKKCDNGVTSVTERDIWESGKRDENLFHVAHCLTQTKNSESYIRQTLRAIILSWGERDEKWVDAKIKSALDREERRERNIQAEVDAFISVTTGDFSVTSCDKELGCVTKRDMAAVRKAISRRKDTLVEKVGNRDGWWRRIDTDIEFMDFNEPDGEPSPILLPLDLHSWVKVYEGNIVLVSGEFNAGKSLFALTTLVLNKNRLPIRYISSEMKVPEIKGRFKWFGINPECWMPDENCKYLPLKNNLSSMLLPDGLNIIDYLEFPDGDFTRAGEYMRQIHDKLKKGVAIVCNQHKVGARLPRSGDLVMEKPRLAIALRKLESNNETVWGVAEILKAKHPRVGKMDGKRLKYEIHNNGSTFKTLIDWGYWKI